MSTTTLLATVAITRSATAGQRWEVVVVAIVAASIIGAVTAYYGGIVDSVIMRILDMFMGIPLLLLAITIAASLGSGIQNLMIAIIISLIPGFTRVIR